VTTRPKHLHWLQQQNVAANAFAEIPEAKIRQFAAEARSLDFGGASSFAGLGLPFFPFWLLQWASRLFEAEVSREAADGPTDNHKSGVSQTS
jgi:hypothetical protein